jgi:hypothetical protein
LHRLHPLHEHKTWPVCYDVICRQDKAIFVDYGSAAALQQPAFSHAENSHNTGFNSLYEFNRLRFSG